VIRYGVTEVTPGGWTRNQNQLFWPPTSLGKSSPARVDLITNMAENVSPRIPSQKGL
jgi:hypothetical protein